MTPQAPVRRGEVLTLGSVRGLWRVVDVPEPGVYVAMPHDALALAQAISWPQTQRPRRWTWGPA